jgi:hypothetical protein
MKPNGAEINLALTSGRLKCVAGFLEGGLKRFESSDGLSFSGFFDSVTHDKTVLHFAENDTSI